MHIVRIHTSNGTVEKKAEPGTNLLTFLQQNGIAVSSPCNGKQTCGKCRVRVGGLGSEASEKEQKALGDDALAKGYRLACHNRIEGDLDIYPDTVNEQAKIITEGRMQPVRLSPVVGKKLVKLSPPDINDQASDVDRAGAFLKNPAEGFSLELMRRLPDILRQENYTVTLGSMDNELIFAEPGDTTSSLFGVAVDIGTTTIAAYLFDLATGNRKDVYSVLNPQRKYGADVLSRIDYTLSSGGAAHEMNSLIVECINGIIEIFCERNNITRGDVYAVVFVGNTTMMHFLMELPARYIAVSPFIPVTTGLHKFQAHTLGMEINRYGQAIVFPSVSAYIGADTVAAVLSSGMYASPKISLLVDIGTNGEIVLGCNKWLYACSTAAGPAFEGANIRNGVGGVRGAIDKVRLKAGFEYTTIEGDRAIGICGSGIVDAIAGMLDTGVIDETGRIVDDDEIPAAHGDLANRLTDLNGMASFLLVPGAECTADGDIAITQKDVREVQNAKAAIAAGIKTLVKTAGIKLEDVDRVYLAGGFGSYINIESALRIGLLPKELKGRIRSIGNAAGAGAVLGLVSAGKLRQANIIKNKIKYIELSALPEFVDEYVECMLFEEDF